MTKDVNIRFETFPTKILWTNFCTLMKLKWLKANTL